MKKIFFLALIVALCNVAVIAKDTDIPKEDCRTKCTLLGYNIRGGFPRPVCYQIVMCKVLKWDEEREVCVDKGSDRREYWVPCRDIPPM